MPIFYKGAMDMFCKALFVFCILVSSIFGEAVETFYGPIEVSEPVILELIQSPAMQRLKHIHQYGVAYYTTHREEYNRYDHSLGVFAILRKNSASLEEQIAGLLHDLSHTVFSHVGDWIFGKEYQEDDYQSTIYKIYLSHSGVEKILLKHGFTINQVFPKKDGFAMLEQSLPNLCADRIDYNLQGAYFQNFLTKQEALELYEDFSFADGRWSASRLDLLKKLANFSLFMTQDCWGGATNYVTSRWLADAIIKGLDNGLLSWHEIHFGIDQDVWDKLQHADDFFILQRMYMVANYDDYYQLVPPEEADLIVRFRFRGIDPWVIRDPEKAVVRLTSIDAAFAQEFKALKEKAAQGWPIKIRTYIPCKASSFQDSEVPSHCSPGIRR